MSWKLVEAASRRGLVDRLNEIKALPGETIFLGNEIMNYAKVWSCAVWQEDKPRKKGRKDEQRGIDTEDRKGR